MAIYSSSYLKNLASTRRFVFEQRLFGLRNAPIDHSFDIFLSHSFLDKDEVQGLYEELTGFGFSVYVDWIVDPQLDRANVTKASAELVRSRMKASKTLLLAISTNASLSKWIPWELGYVDGRTGKCAIIPVSKQPIAPKVFHRTEYLSLYPFIKKVPTTLGIDKPFVIDSEFNFAALESWIQNGLIMENRTVNIFEL